MDTFCDYQDGRALKSEDQYICKSDSFELFTEELTEAMNHSSNERLVSFLNQPQSVSIIRESTYETLVSVISILESWNVEANGMIDNPCNEVLHFLATHCQPNELLLYLVEQIEICSSDQCFYHLLKPLAVCLKRCRNPSTVIDMCTGVINKFVANLPVPNNEQDDSHDNHVERIILSYTHISRFYDDLVNNFEINDHSNSNNRKLKNVLLESLLIMFGSPICHLNLSSSNHYLIISKLLRSVLQIKWDIMYFCKFISHGSFHNHGFMSLRVRNSTNEDHSTVINIDDLSLCNFYWSVLCKETVNIPSAYNPYYIAYSVINISNYLMNCQGNRKVLTIKALDLVNFTLKILSRAQLPVAALDLSIHSELFRNLENCILYPDSEETQKYALKTFIDYTNIFEIRARYLVMKNLIVSDHHSKIKSIVIGIFKNNVAEVLRTQEDSSSVDKNLMYHNLRNFISKICFLTDGMNTSLLNNMDQILVTLNFILFLAINGQRNAKISKILSHSVRDFLTTIRNLIKPQKDLCKSNLDELKNFGTVSKEKGDGSDMRVLLQDPHVSLEQKIQLCHKAINSLFMMENTLDRIKDIMFVGRADQSLRLLLD